MKIIFLVILMAIAMGICRYWALTSPEEVEENEENNL